MGSNGEAGGFGARPAQWRVRVLAAAVLAVLGVAFAGPVAAQAAPTLEDFESPGLSAGTKVSTQFQSNGVYFTESPGSGIYLPVIATDLVRSSTRSLNITTGPVGEEFPHPGLEGRFPTVVEDVSVYVRNAESLRSTVTLTAYRSGGGTVTKTSAVSSSAWTKIEVEKGSGESFFKFQVNAQSGASMTASRSASTTSNTRSTRPRRPPTRSPPKKSGASRCPPSPRNTNSRSSG